MTTRCDLALLARLDACKRTAPGLGRARRPPVKAWGRLPGDDPERDRAETEAAIAAAGHRPRSGPARPPPARGRRRPRRRPCASAPALRPGRAARHRHRRRRGGRDGAGRRAAPAPAGRSRRSPAATPAGASGSPAWSSGARAFAEAQALLDEVELIILAVPDDAIAPLAGELRLYSGQALVHTSGALGAEVLEPAMAAGTQVGAFHPLVAFADTERAIAALHGATVAVEGDDQLATLLAEMAEASARQRGPARARDARPPTTPRRCSPPAASSRCSTRSPSSARWPASTRPARWPIYGPLIEGTLGNARALGIRRRADRPDDPRRRRARWRAHLAALAAPRARASAALPRRRASARSPSRWPVARSHRRPPRRCVETLTTALASARTDASTIAAHGTQHRRQVRGPPGGAIRPSVQPRPRAATRPRRAGLVLRRGRRPDRAAVRSDAGPYARLRAGWRGPATGALGRRRPSASRPLVTMHWARSGRSGRGPPPSAAAAPWRA